MSFTPSIRRNKEVQALQTITSPYQIEIHQPDKSSGKRVQQIDIYIYIIPLLVNSIKNQTENPVWL